MDQHRQQDQHRHGEKHLFEELKRDVKVKDFGHIKWMARRR